MRIYIDEAGVFVPPKPPRSLFSVVLALMIPTAIEADLFYEFLRLRDAWPNQNIEIKGRSLNESQAAQVIDLVQGYDTLVEFIALDTNRHPEALVEKFKRGQADAITANITREHHPGLILDLHYLGEAIREMSNQSFLQAFATWELIIRTIREGTLYFVQRQPEELADIAWIVDRKDRVITRMEETWSTPILPVAESIFAREPLECIENEDYSRFKARYCITDGTADPEMAGHIEWLSSVYGRPPGSERLTPVHGKRLLGEQLRFKDSVDCLGLQLADMLASILRRALNDHLQFAGWNDFGKLLVRHHMAGTGLIQLGSGPDIFLTGRARKVCQVLNDKAKDMLTQRVRNIGIVD